MIRYRQGYGGGGDTGATGWDPNTLIEVPFPHTGFLKPTCYSRKNINLSGFSFDKSEGP